MNSMEKGKNKKKFFETGFGKFIKKAGQIVPDVLEVGATAMTGNIGGAIKLVGDKLNEKKAESEAARNIALEFEQFKLEWELELYQLEVQDRDSARNRETELAKATGKRDIMMLIVGCVALSAFLIIIIAGIFFDVPEERKDVLFHIIGFVEGAVTGVFTYYYGSSKGSKDKMNTIHEMKSKE